MKTKFSKKEKIFRDKASKVKYYEKNKVEIKKRSHEFKKKQRQINIKIRDEFKRNHPCTKCGEKDIRCLDFHHVGDDKDRCINRMVKSPVSTERLLREIKKCIILCGNCHHKLHARNRKYTYNLLDMEKTYKEYGRKEYFRRHRYNQRMKAKRFVFEIKSRSKCKCGEQYVACLDFHHKYNKQFTVQQMTVGRFSVDKIKKELDKCVLICKNCHRKLHIKDKK